MDGHHLNTDPSQDVDDGYFDTDASSSTSLSPSVQDFPVIHDRTYHAFKSGSWALPNDSAEQERLNFMHKAWRKCMDDMLFLPSSKDPLHILDVGTGTGIWAIECADENQAAYVTGTDLSPIQPDWVPPNVKFVVEDAHDDRGWGRTNQFDLVHARGVLPFSKHSPQTLFNEAYLALNPGGWIEIQECSYIRHSDDDTLPLESYMADWEEKMQEGMKNLHMNGYQTSEALEAGLETAKFKNIKVIKLKIPLGSWPKNKRLKKAGLSAWNSLYWGMPGLSAMPFLTGLDDWSKDELSILLAECRKELKCRSIHAWWDAVVVAGQKL